MEVLSACEPAAFGGGNFAVACAMQHELRADREVLLAAVQQDGRALRYTAAELQADCDVVLAALRHRMDQRWSTRRLS